MARYKLTAYLSQDDLDMLRQAVKEERFRLSSNDSGRVLRGEEIEKLSPRRQELIATCYDLQHILRHCIQRVESWDD
jgi:hypothetical protein